MFLKAFASFLKVFPIFFIILFIATWGLLNGYFEQDEWSALSSTMRSYNLPWWNFLLPTEVHFSPLGVILWRLHYAIFKLQAHFYFITELIIHASSASLVYILAARLLRNRVIGVVTGLLFLLNGRAYQAFTHLAIFNTTDTTMFFILLFFVYLTGIKERIISYKQSIILLTIFLTSVGFREEGFMIIPVFFAYLVLFDKAKLNRENIKSFAIFGLGVILYILFRLSAQTLKEVSTPVQYQLSTSRVPYNFAMLPIKLIVQNLINSANIGIFFLNNHAKLYPDMIRNIHLQAAPLMDLGFVYIFSIITGLTGVWMWAIKPKRIGSYLIFTAIWICSHAFLLSFVGHPLYVLEPRYLYFSSFPVFLLLSIIIYSLFTSKSKTVSISLLQKATSILIIMAILITSMQQIRSAVAYAGNSGIIKKKTLSSLLEVHPRLSDNTVFFVFCKTKCDRNGELGIPNENVLPFSSGPGLNILITYASVQNEEKEWSVFMKDYFLFHIYSQDYKKIRNRSFGYFTDLNELKENIKKHKIPRDNIVALEYNEDNYSFRNVTKEFAESLK